MKLFLLYVRKSQYDGEDIYTEGHLYLLQKLVLSGIVDSAEIVIENGEHCDQVTMFGTTVRHVDSVNEILPSPGDIVWVRGGWKSWIPWIEQRRRERIWVMYYGANTGHERWPFWDVVLDDMIVQTRTEGERSNDSPRLRWPYRKPVWPGFCLGKGEIKYDLCVGASHVFDRKGQWRALQAIMRYGKPLRLVIPGGLVGRDEPTVRALQELATSGIETHFPGHVGREQLADIFRASRAFVYAGAGGQGDRSVIEAGLCGCPIMLYFTKNHARYVWENEAVTWVAKAPEDPVKMASELGVWLASLGMMSRKSISAHLMATGGVERCTQNLIPLLWFFRDNPQADRKQLIRVFGYE